MARRAEEPAARIQPPPDLLPVLESAARLQQVVPDAVLVGGTMTAVSALVPRLAHPTPQDRKTAGELSRYKGLVQRWQDWSETLSTCGDLAQTMLDGR